MSELLNLPLLSSGKVREVYELDDDLLMVASDRISTYDVIHPTPIPGKGAVLTGVSDFWFERTSGIVANHLISVTDGVPDEVRGRAMVVKRLEMLPIECIVRGYITGSAWKEYRTAGTMHGTQLPDGLLESAQLPEPVFTPSTKAEIGDHDENISFDQAVDLLGPDLAEQARTVSLELYRRGSEWARQRGIIIADTKFELGLIDGELVVADEVLTHDSSRFWPADQWVPGTTPPSFDKQPLRDLLERLEWNKQPPPPALPTDVVLATRERYVDAYERVTGRDFAVWPGVAP